MSAIAIITFAIIPSRKVENSLESSEKKYSFMESLKLTCSTVVSPKLVQLLPLTILGGVNVAFWLAVFPTAMNFTKDNANLIYIPAIYSLGAGLGEVLMGILISGLSKRIKGFGLKPTMVIGAYPLIFIISFFCGVSDCCINGVRSVICSIVMPQRRAQAFSVLRIYHAAGCMAVFFFSPMVPLYIYTFVLPTLSLVSTFFFFRVVDNTHTMERKITEQMNLEKLEKLREIVVEQQK
ncbi:unnamed protein product [Caenorhabditis brenneri]